MKEVKLEEAPKPKKTPQQKKLLSKSKTKKDSQSNHVAAPPTISKMEVAAKSHAKTASEKPRQTKKAEPRQTKKAETKKAT